MPPEYEFIGPSLTLDFASHALPALLSKHDLYPDESGNAWQRIQRGLREFAGAGGPVRVLNHIVHPLAAGLGYNEIKKGEAVTTREGPEDGGYTLRSLDGALLRAWPEGSGTDLDASSKRGTAARVSPLRRMSRVLRAREECIGLITNGETLRVLLCNPNGPDSQIVVPLGGRSAWISGPNAPESYRLVFAFTSPKGVAAASEIFEAARLHQISVTKTLRLQARSAIEDFLQCVLDQDHGAIALPSSDELWRQALTIVYRLLFILRVESSAEPGGGFSFAASDTWRRCLSPNRALGPLVRRHLDLGHDTGSLLEDGLRILFRVCRDGLQHPTLSIAPLGGGLFDPSATESLDKLRWGDRSVALLLDRLLWTVPRGRERQRVHYGSLDVEELGRIYESLLDLKPDIATSPMMRIRRGRLEAVVPVHQACGAGVEHIPIGKFFLRTSLGRRAGGSYYTPHEFVRYLVRATLSPLVKLGNG